MRYRTRLARGVYENFSNVCEKHRCRDKTGRKEEKRVRRAGIGNCVYMYEAQARRISDGKRKSPLAALVHLAVCGYLKVGLAGTGKVDLVKVDERWSVSSPAVDRAGQGGGGGAGGVAVRCAMRGDAMRRVVSDQPRRRASERQRERERVAD